MNAPRRLDRAKARYPTKAKIETLGPVLVKVARDCGLDVAGIEVSPDGAIRVLEAPAAAQSGSLFDQLKDQL